MNYKYLNNKSSCTGCYACYNICSQKSIHMEADQEGFWYPEVDEKLCINCGKCIKVCPVSKLSTIERKMQAVAAYNKDEMVRLNSSSGGIFTPLAKKVIEKSGVVFGAGFNENFEVEHSYGETMKDLEKFRGSKYVQSKIGYTYRQAKEFLDSERIVLFSGTPCQIGGLISFLGKKYENLICIDHICHGVPSAKVWRIYKSFQEKEHNSKIKSCSFRNKRNGWFEYGSLIKFENKKEYYKTVFKDIYMKAFLTDISLRPSCYNCHFKTLQRESDITLADFWGIQDVIPEINDNKGVSLLMLNSNLGKLMIDEIKDLIVIREVDKQCIEKHNPSAVFSVQAHPERKEFFGKLDIVEFDKLVKRYCMDKFHVRLLRVGKRYLNKLKGS